MFFCFVLPKMSSTLLETAIERLRTLVPEPTVESIAARTHLSQKTIDRFLRIVGSGKLMNKGRYHTNDFRTCIECSEHELEFVLQYQDDLASYLQVHGLPHIDSITHIRSPCSETGYGICISFRT